MRVEQACPFCSKGHLKLIPENAPYIIDHLKCDVCDSTYALTEDDYENGSISTGRVNDPSGNEHKIEFIYFDGLWEIN